MSVAVKDFLKARRDRALGSILGHAEREIFSSLTPEQRGNLRRCVLDALNMYHDSALDLFKADDGVHNDHVVELLERIDRKVTTGSARDRVPPPPGSDPT